MFGPPFAASEAFGVDQLPTCGSSPIFDAAVTLCPSSADMGVFHLRILVENSFPSGPLPAWKPCGVGHAPREAKPPFAAVAGAHG